MKHTDAFSNLLSVSITCTLLLLSICFITTITEFAEASAFTKNSEKSVYRISMNSDLLSNENVLVSNTITTPLTQPSFNTYTNPQFGFLLSYPNSWKILESADEDSALVVRFVPPGEENSFEYLVSFKIFYLDADEDDNLSELLEKSLEDYENGENGYDNFNVIGQSTITDTLSGYPSYSFTGIYNDEGRSFKLTEYGFKINDIQFNIVYYAISDKYEKYMPAIKKMLESFKLT